MSSIKREEEQILLKPSNLQDGRLAKNGYACETSRESDRKVTVTNTLKPNNLQDGRPAKNGYACETSRNSDRKVTVTNTLKPQQPSGWETREKWLRVRNLAGLRQEGKNVAALQTINKICQA